MEKVKITIEDESGKKSEIEVSVNDDNTMDLSIEFTPEIKKDSTKQELYLGVTSLIFKMFKDN